MLQYWMLQSNIIYIIGRGRVLEIVPNDIQIIINSIIRDWYHWFRHKYLHSNVPYFDVVSHSRIQIVGRGADTDISNATFSLWACMRSSDRSISIVTC